MHSRPGRWPLEAAKRLEARGHAQKASAAPEHRAAEGEGGAKRRNTEPPTAAQCEDKRPGNLSLTNQRFVNDQRIHFTLENRHFTQEMPVFFICSIMLLAWALHSYTSGYMVRKTGDNRRRQGWIWRGENAWREWWRWYALWLGRAPRHKNPFSSRNYGGPLWKARFSSLTAKVRHAIMTVRG